MRTQIPKARRIVLKLGTRVLTQENGRLALARLFAAVEAAAALANAGKEVLLVSSGAVGLGRDALALVTPSDELGERQACAAVGQSRLMGLYQEGFSRLGRVCAQVLLTRGDFEDRLRYLNLRTTLTRLLGHGVIPIINENDVVATDELAYLEGARRPVFGDNDRLSALVATKLEADLLVLMTDVEGVYERDPRGAPHAALIERVDGPEAVEQVLAGPGSAAGRGGMRSKIDAALVAQRAGCHAVIASGIDMTVLPRVLSGEPRGTWFPALGGLDARRRWIAFAAGPRGILNVDTGAVDALRSRGASLLASGVVRVEGEFAEGDVVEIRGPGGELVARGMAGCDAPAARAWCGGMPPSGVRNRHALVHRDHLVLET